MERRFRSLLEAYGLEKLGVRAVCDLRKLCHCELKST